MIKNLSIADNNCRKFKMIQLIDNILRYQKTLTFIAGITLNFAFAPIFFWPSLLVLSLLLQVLINLNSSWESIKIGWIFGFGYFLITLHWIVISFTFYETLLWFIPLILVLFSGLMALFFSLLTYLFFLCKKRISTKNNTSIFVFASCWTFIEYLRTWLFTGFPWNLLSHSLADKTLLLQNASLVGELGSSFLIAYTFSGYLILLGKKPAYFKQYLAVNLIIFASSLAFGTYRLRAYPTEFTDTKVRLIQTNLPPSDEINLVQSHIKLMQHIKLSKNNPIEQKDTTDPDLIIWPESALDVPYNLIKNSLALNFPIPNAVLITGGIEYLQNSIYNALMTIDSFGNLLYQYNKNHLVPFGEYIPKPFALLPINKVITGSIIFSSFATNSDCDQIHLEDKKIFIAPKICYEIIFSSEFHKIFQQSNLPNFIVNIANDSWYKYSWGVYQHFYFCVLRAIETGIPIVRVSNAGISGLVDPIGRIISKTTANTTTVIDQNVPAKLKHMTYYVRFGNINVLLLVLAVYIIQILFDRIPNKIN